MSHRMSPCVPAAIAAATVACTSAPAIAPAGDTFTFDDSCGTNNWHSCCDQGGDLFENNWDLGPNVGSCPPLPSDNDPVDLSNGLVILNGMIGGPINIASLTSSGEFQHSQNALNVASGVGLSRYTLFTSGLSSGGSINIGGEFDWFGGSLAAVGGINAQDLVTFASSNSILEGSEMDVLVQANWTGGNILLDDGAVLETHQGMLITGNNFLTGTGGTWRNLGSVSKSPGTGTTLIQHPIRFETSGAVGVGTGTFRIGSDGWSTSSFDVADGATLDFDLFGNHTFRLDPGTSFTGSGLVRSSGVIEVAAPIVSIPRYEMEGGTVTGDGTLRITQAMTWLSGTMARDGGSGDTEIVGNASLSIEGFNGKIIDRRLVTNFGNATWTGSGDLQFRHGGVFDQAGTLLVEGGGDMTVGTEGGTFINRGETTVTTLLFDVAPFVDHRGTLVIGESVFFDMTGGGVFTGPVQIADLAFIGFGVADYVIDDGADFASTGAVGSGFVFIHGNAMVDVTANVLMDRLLLDNGQLRVVAPNTLTVPDLFSWAGGTITGLGTIVPAAEGRLGFGSTGDLDMHLAKISNVATTTWWNVNLRLLEQATFENQQRVTIMATADHALDGDGTGTFENCGTFEKAATSTGETLVQNVTFLNKGTVVCRGGILRFSIDYEQSEGNVFADGGQIIFTFGADIDGGRVQGHPAGGQFVGELNNNGGTLGPSGPTGGGSPAGGAETPAVFMLTGDYTQGAGGTMEIDLAGTVPGSQHDQVAVTGSAMIDGTLHVRLAPGFTPALGHAFTVLTASSISGAFTALDLPALPGLGWDVALDGDSVTLHVIAGAPGDVDGDGFVNVADLLAVIAGWGACPAPPEPCPADVTGDGVVNVADLLLVLANWS